METMSDADLSDCGDEFEQRFHPITLPCESVEDYRPGGYHPVVLGDTFNNGQYRVVRKLGEGSYSTVWLARDSTNARYVALKILVSNVPPSSIEVQILRHLAKEAPEEYSRYVMQLLDRFEHRGPNGVHETLVFEPMGPSVNTMLDELPQFNPRRREMKVRYPPWMAKRILKQSLEALAFLHEHEIAHGAFQPGNMLFGLEDISSKTEEALRQAEDVEARSISPPVKRLDGKHDQWAPTYLCVAQSLSPFTNYTKSFQIKLSDMGGAYLLSNPPIKPVVPLGLRAPELVLTGRVDKSLDIWSFGCLLFELITGELLFCIPSSEFEDDDHLLTLSFRLGTLPEDLYKKWGTSSRYYTADRELFNCELGGVEEGESPLMVEEPSMEELFDEAAPEITEEDASQAKALLRRILRYDPAERLSAVEIASDPWFAESTTES